MTMLRNESPVEVSIAPSPPPRPSRPLGWPAISAMVLLLVTAGLVVLLLPSPRPGVLVTGNDGSLSLIDQDTGDVVYSADNAVTTPDRSRVFRTETDGTGTRVMELDPATGETRASLLVGGERVIRAVSPSGGALALMPPKEREKGLYEPEPREETQITVVNADTGDIRSFTLSGNFEPEIFSLDQDTLFLLEFEPALAPERYYVRQLEVISGRIRDEYTPEVSIEPAMRGHARAQVISPHGDFLFTLYSVAQGEDPVINHHLEDSPSYWSFVHVISLGEEWSHCIFLPAPMGVLGSGRMGLGISPDGDVIHVVDGDSGRAAQIHVGEFRLEGVTDLRNWVAMGAGRPLVAVGADHTLYVGSGATVWAFDAETMQPVRWWDGGEKVLDLDVSGEGRQLRVLVDEYVRVIDLDSGEEVASFVVPLAGGAASIVGPAQGRTNFDDLSKFGCACLPVFDF